MVDDQTPKRRGRKKKPEGASRTLRPGSLAWQLERLKVGERLVLVNETGSADRAATSLVATCQRGGVLVGKRFRTLRGLVVRTGPGEGRETLPVVEVVRVA